jgi:hypothetical protein
MTQSSKNAYIHNTLTKQSSVWIMECIPTWLVANCISIPSFESSKGVAITPALLLPAKAPSN